jgi:hexosaminidase
MASGYKSKIGYSGLNATFFSGVFPNTKGIKGETVKMKLSLI